MLEVGNLQTFEEDRAHFGAWVVVSAPLILGHDLADDAKNDLIWPIITNKKAIEVSQSFAEGDAFHPGGLVKSWTPPAPPGPAPAPTKEMYPWAVPAASGASGWSMASDGTVKINGLCLTASKPIALTACEPAKALEQHFMLASNGNLHLTGGNHQCIALLGGGGPALTTWGCNTGANEVFALSGGKLCSKTLGGEAVCLTPKTTQPGGGDGSLAEMQLWAKPQPAGAVAALVLNNRDAGTTNVSATINFADIRLTSSKLLWLGLGPYTYLVHTQTV